MVKKILCLQRHPPGPEAREALDVILVAGVFDQKVNVLFKDDGVQQLAGLERTEEDGEVMEDSIRSLADYGVEGIFVCADSLERAGLHPDELIVPVQLLNAAEQSALIAQQDMVLND